MSDSRNTVRKTIDFKCPCRIGGAAVIDLHLQDLSARGFKAKLDGFPLHVGESIAIYPEGHEDYRGTVRRSDGEYAGVEFDRELPHAVFERLLYRHAPNPAQDSAA